MYSTSGIRKGTPSFASVVDMKAWVLGWSTLGARNGKHKRTSGVRTYHRFLRLNHCRGDRMISLPPPLESDPPVRLHLRFSHEATLATMEGGTSAIDENVVARNIFRSSKRTREKEKKALRGEIFDEKALYCTVQYSSALSDCNSSGFPRVM